MSKTKEAIVYLSTLFGILAWIAAIFLAPYLKSQSSPWNSLFYAAFSPICHQIPSRCFHLFGHPLAVCARCLGLYAGFLAGTAVYPFWKGFRSSLVPKTKTFLIVSMPIAVDTMGNLSTLWATPDWIRFGLGITWGTLLPFYFLAGLLDLMRRSQRSSRP